MKNLAGIGLAASAAKRAGGSSAIGRHFTEAPDLKFNARKVFLSVGLALVLAACGGGDGGSSTSPQTEGPSSGGNSAPTISGRPGTSVAVGQTYSFQATANDANGDSLTYSAANLPDWLTLNASTGRLTGTPGAADIGTFAGITVSVSDGRASASVPAFSIAVSALAEGRATVSWTAPTENTDGSALTDLAGFTIRYGRSADELTESVAVSNPSLSSYVVENLGAGEWHFAVVAVNRAGVESPLSNVATKTVSS